MAIIITYHLIVSSNVQKQDLQNVFEFKASNAGSNIQESVPKPGPNRLDNPPNEEIIQAKPQNVAGKAENEDSSGKKPIAVDVNPADEGDEQNLPMLLKQHLK